MPIETERPNAAIRLIFRGLLISRIQDKKPSAEIGVIRDLADHPLKFGIAKKTSSGDFEPVAMENLNLNEDITLEVQHDQSASSGIELFTKPGFDRSKDTNDPNDFKWVIDFESSEFLNKPLAVKPNSLKPIIRIYEGVFYALSISDRDINLKRPNGPETTFGKVAIEIGANVYLDPGSKAILKNGSKVIKTFDGKDTTPYKIVFDTDCDTPNTESDFKLVYDALVDKASGAAIDAGKKLDLSPAPSEDPADPAGTNTEPAFSPTVRCVGGNLSLLANSL
jgi:hypothetical protein